MTASLNKFIDYHNSDPAFARLRLGQHFVIMYIKGQWPELFYEQDDTKAMQLIDQWLTDFNYENELPVYVNRLYFPTPVDPKV